MATTNPMPAVLHGRISIEQIEEFARKWQIRELALFGSAARDDLGPQSDVDLLVTFEPEAPWSLFEFAQMQDELSNLVGRAVDLVEESAIRNPYRRNAILRDKTVLYAA